MKSWVQIQYSLSTNVFFHVLYGIYYVYISDSGGVYGEDTTLVAPLIDVYGSTVTAINGNNVVDRQFILRFFVFSLLGRHRISSVKFWRTFDDSWRNLD